MKMVRLTTCGDAYEARALAARLGAEGILWSLRGGHDGPFAIGAVEVLVDADDYEDARDLLASDATWVGDEEPGSAPAPVEEPVRRRPMSRREVVLVVAVLLAAVYFAIVRTGMRV